jgi:toxin-antitoxin system PIN domain toxin
MIAVDTNILVYSHRLDQPENPAAFAAMSRLVAGEAGWAIPWPCLLEFICVVTHPRLYLRPSTLDEALAQVDAWQEAGNLVLLAEHGRSWPLLSRLVAGAHLVGPRVYDARIAGICLAHGVHELWTADRDFGRFPELRTHNPVAVR